jgi:hypothetical protein
MVLRKLAQKVRLYSDKGEGDMQAVKIETAVEKDGMIALNKLPFHAGAHVEIIVIESRKSFEPVSTSYPLRETVMRYDDPFEPVAESEWEALR